MLAARKAFESHDQLPEEEREEGDLAREGKSRIRRAIWRIRLSPISYRDRDIFHIKINYFEWLKSEEEEEERDFLR